MFSLPLFSFTKVAVDENHEGRTSGGYTFIPNEHPRGNGGKFDDNGGPKPYVKENGRASKTSEKRVEETNKVKPKRLQRSVEAKEKSQAEKQAKAKVSLEQQNASYTTWEEAYARKEPERAEILRKDRSHFEHIDLLSKEDIVALKTYQEDSDYVQKYLAFGEKPSELIDLDVEADIKRLSKSIKTFEVKEDFYVFRGLAPIENYEGSTNPKSEESIKASREYIESFLNASKGDVIHNRAFTSGSFDFSVANQFKEKEISSSNGVILGIQLKKGQHALPMNYISSKLLSEREILIDKDSSFMIEEIDKEQRYVFVSLLNKEEKP